MDIFGLEVYIPLRELSYQRIMNAAEYFRPGQRILVKIESDEYPVSINHTYRANIAVIHNVTAKRFLIRILCRLLDRCRNLNIVLISGKPLGRNEIQA